MIDILLSTYNSGDLLEELFNSILSQTNKDWRLVVRDDMSSDETVSALVRFKSKLGERMKLIPSNDSLGVIKSFECLLTKSEADYIMFCDHDDIWLPDKIEKTLKKMKEIEAAYPNNTPILIHTDLKVVDYNLKEINNSLWDYSKLKPYLLNKFEYLGVCNGVTGCTVMINRMGKNVSLPFSTNVIMHDSWLALCISSKRGIIDYVNEATILYRQHPNNTLGANHILNTRRYIKSKFLDIRKTFLNNRAQLELLRELNYGSLLKYIKYKVLYFYKARV